MASPDNRMFNSNRLKLGIFSANCSSGMAVTKIDERWDASWENNVKIAQQADEAGLEFMLPIARWLGYGGETNFHYHVLETLTWCCGLLAKTQGITVFATTHTAFFHPIVAAKQLATIDHIGDGRMGLNVVCGWNKPEYDMFNIPMADEHDVRYAYGQEWFDLVEKIWTTEGSFDWDGTYFQLKNVWGDPKPRYGKPPIMNAGASGQGRDFAARNADYLFTIIPDFDSGRAQVEDVWGRAKAHPQSRLKGVFTSSHVVCRPTEQEARDYLAYYAEENADWDAVDNLMRLQGMHAQSFTKEMLETMRLRFAAGHGTYPLIGTPDQIADSLEQMVEVSGLAGTTLAFVDYAKEFPYFAQEVLPRLEAKGLRSPHSQAAAAE